VSECVLARTVYIARRKRDRILARRHGFTHGTTCGSELCINPDHVTLTPWKVHGTKWGGFAVRLAMLKTDEYFDIPDVPNDAASMNRMRGGIRSCNAAHNIRFSLRSLSSTAGIRVIRTGTYGSQLFGTHDERSNKIHPILKGRS